MNHHGEPCFFPCRKAYELHRNLPASLPACIIRDASRYVDCDEFDEKPDSDDAPDPGGYAPDEADAEEDADQPPDGDEVTAPGGNAFDHDKVEDKKAEKADESSDGVHYRQDAIGRWYKYEKCGNLIFSKPFR